MIIFLITRIPLFLLSFLALNIVGLNPSYNYFSAFPPYISRDKFIEGFTRWDGAWYIDIAQKGYFFHPEGMSSIAFFPMYPLLIRMASVLFNESYVVGIIISNIALFGSFFILYKITKKTINEVVAYRSLLLLSVFPFSFFLSSVYTEALFLFLTLGAFAFAHQKRWILTGIAVALASLTRIQGVFLVPVFLFFYLERIKFQFKKIKLDFFMLFFISILGMLSFIIFNQIFFGEPFAFIKAQQAGWRHSFDLTFSEHRQAIAQLLGLQPIRHGIFDLLRIFNLSIALFYLSLVPLIYQKLGLSYAIYTFLIIAIPLSNSLWSLERFVLVAFPGVIALSLSDKIFRRTAVIFAIFLGFWSTLFFTGHPIQ